MVTLISSALIAEPTGMWPAIIKAFNNGVGNYALGIILLTLCIKFILLPIDFLNRRVSVKNAEMTAKTQPEIQKIKQKYKDPQVQNQKISEVYKKYNVNPMGSCGVLLVCMVVTCVVFFTLFSGLNGMATYKNVEQYQQLEMAYVSVVDGFDEQNFLNLTDENRQNTVIAYVDQIQQDPQLTALAEQQVKEKYQHVKESFLWIKNVWVADSPLASSVVNFGTYATYAGIKNTEETKQQYQDLNKVYDAVMSPIKQQEGVNGYLILTVLTAVTTFFAQLLSIKRTNKKNALNGVAPKTSLTMPIVFTAIMALFTLFYNAVFSLYILVGQLFSLATTPLINLFIDYLDKKKAQKEYKNLNRMTRI